jgi:hypothetical protein
MLDESNSLDMMETPDAPPPEEKSNRTFLIVGGVMAGLVFLTLVCMAVYLLVIRPRSSAQNEATQAAIETQNYIAVQQLTSTAQAAQITPTLTPSPLPLQTSTSIPSTPVIGSPTPVIAIPLSSPAATATNNPATLAAMQTQLAYQMTSTAAAINQGMPATGFFDEVGLPSMVILALALLTVIFLARRMRKSPSK